MKKSAQEWAKHVEAIKAQGISAASYAQKHALARSTLYRWQSKLRRAAPENSNAKATTATTQPGKFVAVRIRETPRQIAAPAIPTATPTAAPCTFQWQSSNELYLRMRCGLLKGISTFSSKHWVRPAKRFTTS